MKQTMRNNFCVIAMACALGPAACSVYGAITIVQEGTPAAQIVLGMRPTRAAQLAAAELQYHVQKITGATLPIVSEDEWQAGNCILVGDSAATRNRGVNPTTLEEQEYVIQATEEVLILAGNDEADFGKVDYASGGGLPGMYDGQATCYAVYDFLERFCGVRWYAPTEAGMVCPARDTLEVTVEPIRRAPAFRYRLGSGEANYQKRQYVTPYRQLWFDPPYEGRDIRLWRRRMRMGGEPFNNGHSFYGYRSMWKQHPEWFAKGYGDNPAHMCFTDPGFLERVVADARESLDTGRPTVLNSRQYGRTYVSIVPMDGGGKGGGWCTCSACREIIDSPPNPEAIPWIEPVDVRSASNYIYAFINRVARELSTTHPEAFVSTLAYPNYSFPPSREPLEPNVAVMMCLRTRNWWVPWTKKRDLAVYQAWIREAEKSGRPLYAWLYYTFPREILGTRMFPGFFAHTAAEQLKMFARDGVRGVFLNGMGEQVDTYVTFKLLDAPTLDVDRLLDDFFTLYYGEAGTPLKQMYLEMERVYSTPESYPERIQNAKNRYTHQSEEIAWGYLGTPERMARWGDRVQKAVELAQTDLEKRRVEAFRQGIWKPMTTAAANYRLRVEREPIRKALRERGAPCVNVPRIPRADGNPASIDWNDAAPLVNRMEKTSGAWPTVDGYPSERVIHGQLAHDGEYLYVRLAEEQFEATGLLASDTVQQDDTWEIYVSGRRGREQAFRRLWVNSRGHTLARQYFGQQTEWASGVRVQSAVDGNSWTVYIALPLETIVEGGMAPGKRYYMNFVRAREGRTPNGQQATLAWSPTFLRGPYYVPRNVHCMSWKVWDTSSMGEIILAE